MKQGPPVLVAVLALSACGASDSPSERVTASIHAFLRIEAEGKSTDVCGFLTPDGRAQLVQMVASAHGGVLPKAKTCAAAAALGHAFASPKLIQALRTADVSHVEVHGSQATAVVSHGNSFPAQKLSLKRKVEHTRPARWLIDGTRPVHG